MSPVQIIIYSVTLLVIVTVFFFFSRNIYKNQIQKVIFPKKAFEEEWEKDKKFNELYQENKRKELMKHQETMYEKQKDTRIYKEDSEIVNIVKPVGKWTKMVMMGGDLMQRLAQLMKREDNKKGFWELFVKAQASTKGKYKGKSR